MRGILEVGNQGFGFLRSAEKSFRIQQDDIHVGNNLVQKYSLHTGHYIVGTVGGRSPRGRGPSLARIGARNLFGQRRTFGSQFSRCRLCCC